MAPQKTPAPNKNAKKKAAAKSGTKIKKVNAKSSKGGVSAFDLEAFVRSSSPRWRRLPTRRR